MVKQASCIAALVAALAAPASAQSVEDAGKFFDQVMTNGATKIYRAHSSTTWDSGYHSQPSGSSTSDCSTKIVGRAINGTSGPYNDYYFNASIDWSKAIEAKHFFTDPEQSGLILLGGASTTMGETAGSYTYSGSTGAVPGLLIQTQSTAMDGRVQKAIDILISACAKSSFGF